MDLSLPVPKVILLAVHLVSNAALDKLAFLTRRHPTVLRREIVLRILLTYLPESVPSVEYVPFIEALCCGESIGQEFMDMDSSIVHELSVEAVSRKLRNIRLRLYTLFNSKVPANVKNDPLALFLLCRAHRVDHSVGLLMELPTLLAPFLSHSRDIRSLAVSTLLPLTRRNLEYYPRNATPYTLAEFQALPDVLAVSVLLSQTGRDGDHSLVVRDLRGLIGPWLCNDARWVSVSNADESSLSAACGGGKRICPGWEWVMEWLITNASTNWRVTCAAVTQWNGASDIDLGDFEVAWPLQEHQNYLDRRYARTIMASAFLVPEATLDALEAIYQAVTKVMELHDKADSPSLASAAEFLSPVLNLSQDGLHLNSTMHMRVDLLSESNPLTNPSPSGTSQLYALVLSAYLMTRAGLPTTVKRVGDLAFSQDEREQRAEAAKLINVIVTQNHRTDDSFWTRSKRELLWLRNWGIISGADMTAKGVFGRVDAAYLENEFLKALLLNSRPSIAKKLYDVIPSPLPLTVLRDTVLGASLSVLDHATDFSRVRERLQKCEQVIASFPLTVHASLPARRRVEYLLKAVNSLSKYRLALKHGEPFTPVVLRVHSDPISIIAKVLEQNPKGYTQIQDLLETAGSIIKAGLPDGSRSNHWSKTNMCEMEGERLASAERRVTAMCIEAALRENDFETAYSYTVNRVANTESSRFELVASYHDHLAWRAALEAGQYTHGSRLLPPVHLGTFGGKSDVRHIGQRLECFSTAVRIAPASQLQYALERFCGCEKQLNSLLKEEVARNIAIDYENGLNLLHRSFGSIGAPNFRKAPSRARTSPSTVQETSDDTVPMSLFDLSRATARAASRNLSALSSLQQSSNAGHPSSTELAGESGEVGAYEDDHHRARMRKRDHLRDAAMGTLTTGVGWLIGAPATSTTKDVNHDNT